MGDACGGGVTGASRGWGKRALFLAAPLRRRLIVDYGIEILEPAEWGLPAYRATLSQRARIDFPGTGISGPEKQWLASELTERARQPLARDKPRVR